MADGRAVPLTCRLNIRHSWRSFSTEDGARYSACTKCGKEKPDRSSGANTIGA
jgi:hypothetical protein